MSSNFPNGPDTIVNNVNNSTPELDTHPTVHNQLADAVMAVETALLPGGMMNLSGHVAAADPHPVYLTQVEGDARYMLTTGGLSLPLTQNLTFSPDNALDIGANAANRPRNVYVASNAYVAGLGLFGTTGTGGMSAGDIIVSRAGNTSGAVFFGSASNYLFFNAGQFQLSGGGLQFTADNTVDIATPGNFRPRDVNLARNLNVGGAILTSDAVNTLAQRNGTNPQTLRLYNTYTDASNYERLTLSGTSLKFEQAGTGVARQLDLITTGNNRIYFWTNNVNRWSIESTGHFYSWPDNAYDIGASGANRPRNVFVAGSVLANAIQFISQSTNCTTYGGTGAPAVGLGSDGDFFFRRDTPATALQRIYQKSAGAWVGIV